MEAQVAQEVTDAQVVQEAMEAMEVQVAQEDTSEAQVVQ